MRRACVASASPRPPLLRRARRRRPRPARGGVGGRVARAGVDSGACLRADLDSPRVPAHSKRCEETLFTALPTWILHVCVASDEPMARRSRSGAAGAAGGGRECSEPHTEKGAGEGGGEKPEAGPALSANGAKASECTTPPTSMARKRKVAICRLSSGVSACTSARFHSPPMASSEPREKKTGR